MKRIHLFEIEDFQWFPHVIRTAMTRLMNVMHGIVRTKDDLSQLLIRVLRTTGQKHIVEMCSGSGGAMPEVLDIIKQQDDLADVQLTMTDLYPDLDAGTSFAAHPSINYQPTPVDATAPADGLVGVRTMVASFHHMPSDAARKILAAAHQDRQPICIFEISDNSFPTFLWWVPIPINFLMCFFVTLKVKPITWQQIVFTYLLPIIPICFAWDGAVSNARTYTESDMEELLTGLRTDDYVWETGVVGEKMKKLYLLGMPK